MANTQIRSADPLVLRFLLDDLPGWFTEFLTEQIGNSDQAGRALFLGVIRRLHAGYLLELRFRAVDGRPDSPQLRGLVSTLLALPEYLVDDKGGSMTVDRELLQILGPLEPGKLPAGTVIRDRQPPVPPKERCTALFPARPQG